MMDLPVEPGSVIADKYRIVREIGRGGMGVVFAADHLQLPKQVALKLLLTVADPVGVERFTREARIVVQIQSEHVCRVLDVGALPSGEPYVVMELLDGQDLAQRVASTGPLPVPTAIDYVLQAGEALAEAHLLGVVHRDLKPNNLFVVQQLDGSESIKVLDFGIAKSQPAAAGEGLTQTGSVLGSPRFMSPEQLKSSRDVDLRSDVWSVGAVIYELLSGQAAFAAETMAELCVVILQDEPAPLGELSSELPAGLSDVVDRCLQKDRGDRYASFAELALALAPFAPDQARDSIERIVKLYEATGWKRPSGTDEVASIAPATAAKPQAVPQPPPAEAAPVAPAQSAALTATATTSTDRSGNVVWIGLTVGCMFVVLVVIALGALLVALSGSETTSPQPAASGPDDTTTAEPVAADMYQLAPKLVADAVQRHGGEAAIYELTIYRGGTAQVELQHRSKPTSVVRYHYRSGGEFHKKDYAPLNDSDRAEVATAVFPRSAVDFGAVARIRDDALRRGAKLEQPIVFYIGLKRGDWRKGPPVFTTMVEGADLKLNLVYDAHGRFVKKL